MTDFFRILKGLQIDEGDLVVTGTIDPSVTGYAADEGSLFLRNNPGAGELWLKTGAANTAWSAPTFGGPFQPLDSDLTALSGIATTGIYVITGAGTSTTRSLVAPAAGITIANPTGVAGNPTFALANDLAALEGLAGTGIAVRTGVDTWTNRTILGTAARITLTNGSGVAGDPTVDISAIYVGQASITTLGTITTGTWNASTLAILYGGTGATTALDAFNNLSPLTTKGDVLTHDVTNNIRLPVGTDGQRLTADSTQASGLKWVTTTDTGTVTSVAATAPTEGFTITGSPITTSGTFVFTLTDDLAALEALVTTGIAVRTGVSTWTTRTITGTANRITVTDGSGVAANPTLDISATYVGQTSITTLGTITTGVWNGTTIGATFGGTGQTAVVTGDLLYGSAANTWSRLAIGTANQVLGVNAAGTNVEYKSFVAGTNISITHGVGTITIATTGVQAALRLYAENPVAETTPLATGTNSVAIGTSATASGLDSFAIGENADASNTNAMAFGSDSLASGADSVAIGTGGTASGANSIVLGGNNNTASASFATAKGSRASATHYGETAQASGRFTVNGDAQSMILVMWNETTNATVTELFLDGTAAAQQLTIPSDTTWLITANIVARRTDANNESAGYIISGVFDRNVAVGTTAIVGALNKTVIAEDTAAWDATLDADTATGAVRIRVTGQAAKTIHWVATVVVTQITG